MSLHTATTKRSAGRRTALAMAVAVCLGSSGAAFAQSTTATIFGQAPIASGEAIQITGGAGFNRTVAVGKSGRYSVTLPVGTYTVNLLQNGKIVQSRKDVTPEVAGGKAVNFVVAAAASTAGSVNAQKLSTITVTASAVPAIDVNSTRESMVITAAQLRQLPLARSGEAIALLAPGTVAAASQLAAGPTGQANVSFGGSSDAENAYFINGFNSSDPIGNQGGITLPYGSIAQQQTLTSGYGAEYGRSAGGVISQVGKSGTNDWHFGAQALWQPAFARSNYTNWHYANPAAGPTQAQPGSMLEYRQPDTSWETVYDAYISGPLIKDKLFFFLSGEVDKQQQTANQNTSLNLIRHDYFSLPKIYGKLDWNINDSNILSLTGIESKEQYHGFYNNYDNTAHQSGAFSSYAQSFKHSFGIWIAQYTSYITDNLTLNALYGKMNGTYYTVQPGTAASALPSIINPNQENPALTGGNPNGISNSNPVAQQANTGHQSSTSNLRLDLDWKLGQHDFKFGIDNQTTQDLGDGSITTGPGYAWQYNNGTPNSYIVGTNPAVAPWVDAPGLYPNGAGGYYVSQYKFNTSATVRVQQRAQYIEDNWQVTDNLLLNLGLRNDQFTNYNALGVPYVRLTSGQLAPRIGFSWDVFGDSSLKVYGNAGRYYLALPAGLAVREASASTFTNQYYTYSGIDANGIPQGLTPINANPQGPVSLNNEYGQALDPKTVRSKNLKAEYQDEFVLGMQQQINKSWVYGVQGMYRRLGRIVDDVADTNTECAQLVAQNPNLLPQLIAQASAAGGVPVTQATLCNTPSLLGIQGSVLINPESTNTFRVSNGNGGFNEFSVSPAQFGFPKASRKYYSLEAYLEHPFDGKWYGKLDYVFSKSYGSTEGPVQSNIGQGGTSVSITTQWDYGSLMQYANGVQANSRKHVLKAYGSYQINPEWMLSGILTIASGTPRSCLGWYGPNQIAADAYPGYYHWCGGMPAPSGSTGYTPWIHQLNLSVEYRPSWADKKLAFQLQVNNVLNEQKVVQYYPFYGQTTAGGLPDPSYRSPQATETPRYVQLGVTYDW